VALFYRFDDRLQFTRGEIRRGRSTPVRFRRRAGSILDRYAVDFAPFPQGRFSRLGLEIVPSIERPLSLPQIPEPRIAAHAPDFIEFVRKKLSGELEHQRFAEIELLPVGDRIYFSSSSASSGHASMSSSTSVCHRNLPVFRQRTASCSCGSPMLANSNACSSSFQSTVTGIGVLPFAAGGGATSAVIASEAKQSIFP
jgi:hypothetical protein